MTTDLRPSEIRFSQNQIRSTFRHGSVNKVMDTFESLLKRDISVSSITRIDVQRHNEDDELKDKYFVVDGHRRLFIFKKLEEAGKLHTITVDLLSPGNVRLSRKFTTNNNGTSIECWDDKDLESDMDDMLKIYRSSGPVKH